MKNVCVSDVKVYFVICTNW